MRLRAFVLGVACVLGTTGPAAQPASAASVGQDDLDGTWSCAFPPDGYTFDAIHQVLNVCGTGFGIQYRLRLPVDGLTACAVPPGWAVTFAWSSTGPCALSGTTFQFRLATPTEGLWSCNVPRGWTIRHQMMVHNTCGSGQTPMFQLTR